MVITGNPPNEFLCAFLFLFDTFEFRVSIISHNILSGIGYFKDLGGNIEKLFLLVATFPTRKHDLAQLILTLSGFPIFTKRQLFLDLDHPHQRVHIEILFISGRNNNDRNNNYNLNPTLKLHTKHIYHHEDQTTNDCYEFDLSIIESRIKEFKNYPNTKRAKAVLKANDIHAPRLPKVPMIGPMLLSVKKNIPPVFGIAVASSALDSTVGKIKMLAST
jgi:hypothetical protein